MVHRLEIPEEVEAALRAQAEAEGKALDDFLRDVLAERAKAAAAPPRGKVLRDLSFMRSDPADADEIDRLHDEWFERIEDEPA